MSSLFTSTIGKLFGAAAVSAGASYLKDTFSNGVLKWDIYTKPEKLGSLKVPEVLLSGNHKEISKWREENSLLKTFLKRPDLFEKIKLSKKQKKLLEELASKAIL